MNKNKINLKNVKKPYLVYVLFNKKGNWIIRLENEIEIFKNLISILNLEFNLI